MFRTKESGFASLLVLVALIALVSLFAMFMYVFVMKGGSNSLRSRWDGNTVEDQTGLNAMDEDVTTPDAISNDVVEELDTLILNVETDTTLDADLSDLSQ